MNERIDVKNSAAQPLLVKADPATPALTVIDGGAIAIRPGTIFRGVSFDAITPIKLPPMVPGGDYAVVALRGGGNDIIGLTAPGMPDDALGGFHFAPGGNAVARKGGDSAPAINLRSFWDRNFRPACPDLRGMSFEARARTAFWGDIYMLGVNHHVDGTSRFGVVIADGDHPPIDPATGEAFDGLNYATAVAVMKHHGKGLMSTEEFAWFTHGVTERSSAARNPRITGLDAARTSQSGAMQAAGNKWVWGHDGDPDAPRASFFGGSWISGGHAGSRCADVAYVWPEYSAGTIGARGRSDHLQLA